MIITTSQGHQVELLPVNGRSSPHRHRELVAVRVAVDGRPCPAWQVPAEIWQREAATLPEPEFWQNVADAALSMSEMESALRI